MLYRTLDIVGQQVTTPSNISSRL